MQLLSTTQTASCVNFQLKGLNPLDTDKPRVYIVFIETGDGNFLSFTTNSKSDGASDTFDFSHNYIKVGDHEIKTLAKAIYSDDGDPLVPTIPINVPSLVDECAANTFEQRHQPLPDDYEGPAITSAFMPKFGEVNTYVLHFGKLNIPSRATKQYLLLFYNETEKTYSQWNTPAVADELFRSHGNAEYLDHGLVSRLTTEVIMEDATLVDKYSNFIAFRIPVPQIDSTNNIFISLVGHPELEAALSGEKQTLEITAAHYEIGQSTTPTNNTKSVWNRESVGSLVLKDQTTESTALGRFHDPNYITVSPEVITRGEESLQEWEYTVRYSNEGSGDASVIKLKCYLDTQFFDLNTLRLMEHSFGAPTVNIYPSHLSFEWEGVTLPGSRSENVRNGDLDVSFTEGKLIFRIRAKNNPPTRNQVFAFLEVFMSDTVTSELTAAKHPAIITIRDLPVHQSTNYKPLLWAIIILSLILLLLLLGIIFFCCN